MWQHVVIHCRHNYMNGCRSVGNWSFCLHSNNSSHIWKWSIKNEWQLLRNDGLIKLKHFKFFGYYGNCGRTSKDFNINKGTLIEALKVSDIIIINLGLHFNKCRVSEYRKSLKDVAKVLKQHITTHPNKEVLFRNTLPQHFRHSKDGYLQVFNKSEKCLTKIK